MITDGLLFIMLLFLQGFVWLLPSGNTYTLPAIVHTAVISLNSNLYIFDPIFPITDLVAIVLLSLSLALGLALYNIQKWIIEWIRGK